MRITKTNISALKGFTIIELVVVIAVIAILASISIVGYGGWRKNVADSQVKSDLNAVASAMESARTFNNTYPTSLPSTVSASEGVTLTPEVGSGGASYCVDGVINSSSSSVFYIASETKDQGALSGTCATRPSAQIAPSTAPSGLTATTISSGQINLSWTAAPGSGVTYTVQRSTDASFVYVVGEVSGVVGTSRSSSGLTSSSTYFYRVRADNSGGSSAWSASATATTSQLSAPTGFIATAISSSQINQSWNAMSGSDDITFTVQRATNTGFTTGFGEASGITGTSRSSTGLNNSTTYYYRIKASDAGGESAWSSTVNATTLPPSWNWTQRTTAGSRYWIAFASSADGTKLVGADASGYIYTSADSGATWTQRTAAGSRSWLTVASSADGTKLVASSSFEPVSGDLYTSYILTSTDSGASWTTRLTTSNRYWDSIASSDDGTKLVATNGYGGVGYIYTSTNSGAAWTQQSGSGSRDWGNVASSSDGVKLVAPVLSSSIYTSTNSGAAWTARAGSGSRYWFDIASSADGTKLAAAPNGETIYTSTDSGVTWTSRAGSGARSWMSISSSADGTKLAAHISGSSGYIFTSSDSGVTWTQQTSAGARTWGGVKLSGDGTEIVGYGYPGYVFTGVFE